MISVLFAGEDYYPGGGDSDILAVWDVSAEEAIARAEQYQGERFDNWKQLVELSPTSLVALDSEGAREAGPMSRVVAEWHRTRSRAEWQLVDQPSG